MKNSLRTLASAILTKISSVYAKKDEVSESVSKVSESVGKVSESVGKVSKSVTELSKSVPIIQKAEVGQTVLVKTVDKDGKPTEWEAGVSSPVPIPTTYDNGKFLRVVNGTPAWTNIPNAEEATFG